MKAALWCLASRLTQAADLWQGLAVSHCLHPCHHASGSHAATAARCPRLPCAAGELQWMCYDMLSNRNEWWVPGKLVDIRQRLEPYWRVSRLLQSN